MKPKSIHTLYNELPSGTPEEFPERFKWLDRHLRSLERANQNHNLETIPKTITKTPPDDVR
jgi:hypothetical protein